MSRTILAIAALSLLGFGCAADVDLPDPSSSLATGPEMLDPWRALPDDTALRDSILTRRAIDLGNSLGRTVFSRAMNSELARAGVSTRYEPVPSVMMPDDTEAAAPAPSGSCPYVEALANDGLTNLSCRYLAERARDEAYVDVVVELDARPLPIEFEASSNIAAVQGWYETASDFGIDGELTRAIEGLRANRACDQAPSPVESSFEAGVALGRQAIGDAVRAQQAITDRRRCDFDAAIVRPSLTATLASVGAILEANALCPGVSPVGLDEQVRFAEARHEYGRGLERGIAEGSVRESERLFREWVCTPPVPSVPSGDPLVLDLDGDGIRIEPVGFGPMFDFGTAGRVQTAWTEPGDAFVVLDRDRNGSIVATELFGDVTVTEDGMMARDGIAALALYDAASRGGNGDGHIDAADVVYASLSAWTDLDGDAVAAPGELRTLEEAGVTAIDLDALSFQTAEGRTGLAADLVFEALASASF